MISPYFTAARLLVVQNRLRRGFARDLSGLKVREIAGKLNKSLGEIFIKLETEALKKQIEDHLQKLEGTELRFGTPDGHLLPYSYKAKDGRNISDTGAIDTIQMIVAGIDDDKIGRAYVVVVAKAITNEKEMVCKAEVCLDFPSTYPRRADRRSSSLRILGTIGAGTLVYRCSVPSAWKGLKCCRTKVLTRNGVGM